MPYLLVRNPKSYTYKVCKERKYLKKKNHRTIKKKKQLKKTLLGVKKGMKCFSKKWLTKKKAKKQRTAIILNELRGL